jgi:hypothetical protein
MMLREAGEAAMEKKDNFTKILTLLGTILIWFPVLAPLLAGIALLFRDGMFRFDYLMPAELFLSALIGGAILFWAAVRARSYHKLIGWGMVSAVALLFGGQGLAVVTGLASGTTEPTPLLMGLVITPIILYAVILAGVGVCGVLLWRELFKTPAI